jgi:hypothetical protein
MLASDLSIEQESGDQADDGVVVGEDADDVNVRRLISPLSRSSGFVECSLARWACGKSM